MVARIQAAIVFQCHALAAELAINADLRFLAHPLRHGRLEQVDAQFADVAAVPVVPDLAEEVAPVIGIDRPARDYGVRVPPDVGAYRAAIAAIHHIFFW